MNDDGMSTFRFKRFEVVNERSAMKVNTDGVLLGASMTITPSDRRFLDVGTGTGTIALMAAQRASDMLNDGFPPLRITAIDIDEPSSEEAAANFRNSPWSDILEARNESLETYLSSLGNEERFDLIFSNPPYFEEDTLAPELRRNNARHTSTGLSYRELTDLAAERLSPDGRLSMVLPADTEHNLTRYARMTGLHLFRILRIRTVPRKSPIRIIAEFSLSRCMAAEDRTITIHDEGKYSEEYLSLTRDFYLFA